MDDRPDQQEMQQFAASFRRFLEWVHTDTVGATAQEVVDLLHTHLGPQGTERSVVTRELAPFDHVNLQAALNAWLAQEGRVHQVHGYTLPPHFQGVGLSQLLSGEGLPMMRLSPPELIDLPSGPGQTLACYQTALLLVADERGSFALLVRGPSRHEPGGLALEVAGLEVASAQAVQSELVALTTALNVYRGHVLELRQGMAGLALDFASLPLTAREDVILPEEVLRRIDRHTADISAHRNGLLAAGQHLKRGLLLFGPPGTGKTHTTRYVIGRMAGSTVLLLTGQALHMIGQIAGLARVLAPAVLVLEDVDLVAEDRGFGPGPSPVLFELLDAMDGAAADADLLFLLTTNRADLLEPALAARPGRVDVAVEIGLPDPEARARLLSLYARGVPLDLDDAAVANVVERTDGTTASFMKELLRRAVLESLANDPELTRVTAVHVSAALDDLLDSTQQVTRALLGAGGGQQPGLPDRAAGGHGGWFAYGGQTMPGARPASMPMTYRDYS